ncbi:MAG: hypothetical protein F6K28_48300 [Microcoleus sp. SIO2G3]|nr:hypothetical protein [Microcoleus sp. SIO2G3]
MSEDDLPRIALRPISSRKQRVIHVEASIKDGLAVHVDINSEESGGMNLWAVSHAETGFGLICAIPDRPAAFFIQEKLLEFGDWQNFKNWTIEQWWQARDFQASLCHLLSCRATAIDEAQSQTQAQSVQFLYAIAAKAVEQLSEAKKIPVASCWQKLIEVVNSEIES